MRLLVIYAVAAAAACISVPAGAAIVSDFQQWRINNKEYHNLTLALLPIRSRCPPALDLMRRAGIGIQLHLCHDGEEERLLFLPKKYKRRHTMCCERCVYKTHTRWGTLWLTQALDHNSSVRGRQPRHKLRKRTCTPPHGLYRDDVLR